MRSGVVTLVVGQMVIPTVAFGVHVAVLVAFAVLFALILSLPPF